MLDAIHSAEPLELITHEVKTVVSHTGLPEVMY